MAVFKLFFSPMKFTKFWREKPICMLSRKLQWSQIRNGGTWKKMKWRLALEFMYIWVQWNYQRHKCTGAKGSFGIAVIMRKHWFVKISQYFHANNHGVMSINAQRKPVDKLYLVRPVLDAILRQIEDNYVPYWDLSIDKAMIAFRKHLSFRQYLPAKLTKYGVKIWEICDARNVQGFPSGGTGRPPWALCPPPHKIKTLSPLILAVLTWLRSWT